MVIYFCALDDSGAHVGQIGLAEKHSMRSNSESFYSHGTLPPSLRSLFGVDTEHAEHVGDEPSAPPPSGAACKLRLVSVAPASAMASLKGPVHWGANSDRQVPPPPHRLQLVQSAHMPVLRCPIETNLSVSLTSCPAHHNYTLHEIYISTLRFSRYTILVQRFKAPEVVLVCKKYTTY